MAKLPSLFCYLLTDRLFEALQHPCIVMQRFRLFPVRSPLLGESRLISFPPDTEMFQFSGFASPALYIQTGDNRT